MQINEVLENIPSIIGDFINCIYCVNQKENITYKIKYTGKSLKILKKEDCHYLAKCLSIYPNVCEEILKSDNYIKCLNESMLIYGTTFADYKVILFVDLRKEASLDKSKQSILIADDSPIITKFFSKIFMSDYNVLVAHDGSEAIKLIEEQKKANLVGAFIDLKMPNKNGFEVLEYMKNNDLFRTIPTSVISGDDSQDGIEKATSYAIIDMLQKPFDEAMAKSIVSKTIQHKKSDN